MDILRARLLIRYVLGEMIPTFFLGVFVFVFILLTLQALRLTEFVLVHGVKVSSVGLMMVYLSTSFLPVLFPMSLLFTILLTYGRLSADSEIVAFRAVGLDLKHIMAPAVILSILVAILSAQMAFHIAPWGNRQFELLVTKVGTQRPGMVLKGGTFSDGFFDLVVYANHVDTKKSEMEQVFIYDERNARSPFTVIAQRGRIINDPDKPGYSATLRLADGSIHRVSEDGHTKINFTNYDIHFSDPVAENSKQKSTQSYNLNDIREALRNPKLEPKDRFSLLNELNKRWALSAACIIFSLVGVGLGTVTNRRTAKSGGIVMCLGMIVSYWIIFVISESLSKQGFLPAGFGMWIPNLLFAIAAFFIIRRARN